MLPELPAASFWKQQRHEAGEQERRGGKPKGESQSMLGAQPSDGKGSGGAHTAPEVVGDSLGTGADRRGEDLGGDRAEPAEVPGAEKSYQWTDQQQASRVARAPVDGNDCGCCENIAHVSFLTPYPVADEPERNVSQPHPNLHHDNPGGSVDDAQTGSTARCRQAEVGGDPREQSPPRKHRSRIGQGRYREMAAILALPKLAQTGNAGLCSGCLFRSPPDFGLRNSPADPERYQRRRYSCEKDGAPTPSREDESGKPGGERVADGPGTLHDSHGFASMTRGPGLCNESGAAGPLSAHSQAQENSEQGQLRNILSQAAGRCKNRIDQDAGQESAGAPDSVRQESENSAPCGRGGQRERGHQARRSFRHAEVAHHVGKDHRVQHDVHAVEHPPQRGGQERALLDRSGFQQPHLYPLNSSPLLRRPLRCSHLRVFALNSGLGP